MRIRSLRVRNLKIHADRAIEFDDRLTLITGANETGKSTLLEALEAAFFLRSCGKSQDHQALQSRAHAGPPEVTVVFEAGGRTYTLKKVFKGTKGTSLLREDAGATWRDDKADEHLAKLLGVTKARKLTGQWSHLFVRQGHGRDNPKAWAGSQSQNLVRHLQQEGGAAVVLSHTDHQVAEYFAELHEETFQKNGNPKVGSPLGQAQNAMEKAEALLAQAQERCSRLAEAAERHALATRAIASKTEELDRLRPQVEAARAKYAQAEELAGSLEELARMERACVERWESLVRADARIGELRRGLEASQKALAPLEADETRAEAVLREAELRLAAADEACTDASSAEAADRLRKEFTGANVQAIERKTALGNAQKQSEALERQRKALRALEEQISRLPAVDARTLAQLGRLEEAAKDASTQLAAAATHLRLQETDSTVRVGGELVGVGSDLVLTGEVEIQVGTGTRILLAPGGKNSLEEARESQERAARTLHEALQRYGLTCLDEARTAAAQRTVLVPQLDKMKADIEALNPERIEATLREALSENSLAENILVGLHKKQAPSLPVLDDLTRAREAHVRANQSLQASSGTRARAEAARKAARTACEEARDRLQKFRKALAHADTERKMASARLDLLLSQQGEDADRQKALAEALHQKDLAVAAHKEACVRCEALPLEPLREDVSRLTDSIQNAENALLQARTDRALAEGTLRQDGSQDPEADRARARILRDDAGQALEAARRMAEARKLVHRLFTDHRARIAREYTRPLVGRINAYLQRLFGRDVRAEVVLNEDSITGIQISRRDFADIPFDFDVLSGGAAEQVGAAIRLAMAEILARDHDGCLPVVFDDAFTNSDPERLRSLLGMLYFAAENGLQMILLSCDPGAYSGCGAREIQLGTPALSQVVSCAGSEDEPSGGSLSAS